MSTLLYLYGFWVGAWVIFKKAMPAPGLSGLAVFLLRGGGWVFYFLVVLMICTLIGWAAAYWSRRNQWIGLGCATGVVIATHLWLHQDYRWTTGEYYWLPTSFVMMPFFAVLIVPHLKLLRDSTKVRYKWILILLALVVVAALVEWHFRLPGELVDTQRRWVPKHARLSTQFGAVVIMLCSLGYFRPPNRVMAFFSRNSLGTFCLHPFLIHTSLHGANWLVGGESPILVSLVASVVLVVGCCLISEFLRSAFQHRLV